MPSRFAPLPLLIAAVLLAWPALAQQPNQPPMPPDARMSPGQMPGQAPPVPLPPASIMANTQAKPAAAAPQPAANQPDRPAQPAASQLAKQDTLTVVQLFGKLQATRDFMWENQDKLQMIDYLTQIRTLEQKMGQLPN